MPKLFTVEEANGLIPTIEQIMLRVRERKRELDQFRQLVDDVAEKTRGNGHTRGADLKPRAAAAQRAADELNKAIDEVTSLGCVVKDLDQGLIDFPHERDGVVVYLCWRLGETSIAWWHEVEAGFRGRQPL